MEARETEQSSSYPYSNASNSNPQSTSYATPYSPPSPSGSASAGQGGAKPWILVLVFAILILLFLPTLRSSSSRLAIKNGWDVVNLCLVIVAILCGVLGRTGDGSGSDKTPRQIATASDDWFGSSNQTVGVGSSDPTTGIRRMRSSQSYPDLRLETYTWGQNAVPENWRFFDDSELYRNRRSVQAQARPDRVSGFEEEGRERECKTIQVDTQRVPNLVFDERVPKLVFGEKDLQFDNDKEKKEAKEPIFEEEVGVRRRRGSFESIPKINQAENESNFKEEKRQKEPMLIKRRRRRSLESFPVIEEENVAKEQIKVTRERRRSLEKFPNLEEVAKESNFKEEELHEKQPLKAIRRLKSVGSLPDILNFEKEGENRKNQQSGIARHRGRSLEKYPKMDELTEESKFEKENIENQKHQILDEEPPPVAPPPPPPPPPPPAKPAHENGKKHKRNGSNSGAKDLAVAITLFYKKRRGHKSKKNQEEPSINASNHSPLDSNTTHKNASTPPPPPPPPPSSIFNQIFSNKKGGSISRRIHSFSSSTHNPTHSSTSTYTTPPPPPPPPSKESHRSRKDNSHHHYEHSSHYKRTEKSEHYDQRRREKSNLSPYSNYPLPPRSPLPPPPPSPPPLSPSTPIYEIVGESKEEEERKGKAQVFCPSPDVNDKADMFIKRFRNGLQLEKNNSIKLKEQRNNSGQVEVEDEDEGEFMMVGSMFD